MPTRLANNSDSCTFLDSLGCTTTTNRFNAIGCYSIEGYNALLVAVTVFAIFGSGTFALKVLFENQLARNFYLGAKKSSILVDVPTRLANNSDSCTFLDSLGYP